MSSKSSNVQKYDVPLATRVAIIQLLVMFRAAPSRLILREEEDHSFNPIKSHMWSWHGEDDTSVRTDPQVRRTHILHCNTQHRAF